MNEILFEPAKGSDERQIGEILRSAGLPAEDVTPHLSNFILAKENRNTIGCAGLEIYGKIALLRSVAVLEPARSHGIAARLCEMLLKQARKLGIEEVFLLTTSAANYFEKQGFRRIERNTAPAVIQSNKQFTSLCPSSAVLMKKQI